MRKLNHKAVKSPVHIIDWHITARAKIISKRSTSWFMVFGLCLNHIDFRVSGMAVVDITESL